ncbi:hypothetical protein SAMN02745121_06329 [Nannocystis exedens]|uniref:DUF4142 domain-containing protein n=1 Tax=Nannocystis exedens TaxID=54 RepID=A0A1I2EYF4_9BACT|nr:DUF4142 domain-containing protein [Nannocystis exedens]PCC69522.1 hypothetical protein NAEX_02544 [Nannocystis exedens]SFE97743.1 hypothetical protein SAMN02745121_06329 [Nannocystis exedens]
MSICRSVVAVAMLAVGSPSAQAAPAPALPSAALPSPPASDAELLGVLAAIHAINREAAAPARERGTDRRMRALAETITRHAAAGQRRLAALSVLLEQRAVGGDTTDGLRFAARRAFPAPTSRARGREFDDAWLEGQIETLTLVIDAINNKSRPYARAPALQQELVVVVEQAAADLFAAEALRAALARPTS